MLKAALLCSVVCTAFVVGDRTSVATQDKPAQAGKPVSLHEVLRPYVGKKCALTPKGSLWVVGFRPKGPERIYKFDMLGTDFMRCVAGPNYYHYVPFASISIVTTN